MIRLINNGKTTDTIFSEPNIPVNITRFESLLISIKAPSIAILFALIATPTNKNNNENISEELSWLKIKAETGTMEYKRTEVFIIPLKPIFLIR